MGKLRPGQVDWAGSLRSADAPRYRGFSTYAANQYEARIPVGADAEATGVVSKRVLDRYLRLGGCARKHS